MSIRAEKTCTSLPFSCPDTELCRRANVPRVHAKDIEVTLPLLLISTILRLNIREKGDSGRASPYHTTL